MMMKKLRVVFLAIQLMVLLSCATAGKSFNADMVKEKIVIGASTKGEVVQLCGDPLSKNAEAAEGLEVWHYAYVDKNITGAGIITSSIGMGQEWKSKTIVMDIYFKNDIVVDYRLENSQVQRFNYR